MRFRCILQIKFLQCKVQQNGLDSEMWLDKHLICEPHVITEINMIVPVVYCFNCFSALYARPLVFLYQLTKLDAYTFMMLWLFGLASIRLELVMNGMDWPVISSSDRKSGHLFGLL